MTRLRRRARLLPFPAHGDSPRRHHEASMLACPPSRMRACQKTPRSSAVMLRSQPCETPGQKWGRRPSALVRLRHAGTPVARLLGMPACENASMRACPVSACRDDLRLPGRHRLLHGIRHPARPVGGHGSMPACCLPGQRPLVGRPRQPGHDDASHRSWRAPSPCPAGRYPHGHLDLLRRLRSRLPRQLATAR
jgi:hypothetical protein